MTTKASGWQRHGVIYTLLAIGVLTLIMLNFWGWLFLRGVESTILQQLQQQQQQTARIYARDISANLLGRDLLDFSLNDDLLFTRLPFLLYNYKLESNLQTIILASADRSILLNEAVNPDDWAALRRFPMNDSLFTLAAAGIERKPELIRFSGNYFLTSYTPVLNEDDLVTGVLVIEAPARLFATLQDFRTRLAWMGIAGLLLIMLFAGIIVLAIRQLFQAQEALAQQSRLAHLGQMAAMVAHEIRNPLSIIKGSAEVLRRKYAAQEDEMFGFIPDEIDRLNRLVNDFLQFARQRQLQPVPLHPARLLNRLLESLEDPRISIDAAFSGEVRLDEDAMRQILLNIIGNARQATPADGTIGIHLSTSEGRRRLFSIQINDSGSGMDKETLAKVFDPFFSTRATGSGLGMAITRQLVEQMGGSITISSTPGQGTRVRMDFPL